MAGVTGAFSPAQFSEGLVGTLGAAYIGLALRAGPPGSGNGYWWLARAGGLGSLFGYISGGAFTELQTPGPFVEGDFIRMEGDGDNFNLLVNGVSIGIYADATYPVGQPGLSGFDSDLVSGMVNLRVGDLREPSGLYMTEFTLGF